VEPHVVQTRHDKAADYGKAGVARVQQLMVTHDMAAKGQAMAVLGQMTVAQSQLDLGINSTDQEVAQVRDQFAKLDAELRGTPCLTTTGTLATRAPPSCAPLPILISQYQAARQRAEELQTQMQRIDTEAKDTLANRVKEAERATQSQN